MNEVFIYDAVRTPRGKGKASVGALAAVSPIELAATPLRHIANRNNLETKGIGDVILGCVDPVRDQGGDLARSAVLAAGYDESVPGVQINRFCASGLEACAIAAGKVAGNQADMAIGGGVEVMSRIPMLSSGMPPLSDPAFALRHKSVPQGVSADLIASRQGHSRSDVDSYAVESHRRASRAWDEDRFQRSIVPVEDRSGVLILERDETVRSDSSLQRMGSLKPAFARTAQAMGYDAVALQAYPEIAELVHVHHAGNSSQIVDGAAAILMGTKEAGAKNNLSARARIRSVVSVGSEPTIMLTGPTEVCRRALKMAGVTQGDIDLWELNEAFASVVLNFLEDTDLPHDEVNVNGGAIAMGHPLGATGAMILGTLVDELHRADKQLGVATLCAASGQAIAMVIERV